MMPDKKPDSAKSEGDSAKPGPGKEPNANGRQGGGLLAWLPLILTVVLMPVLAFTTTKFLIIPKVAAAREAATGEAETADPTPEASREAVKETKETKDNHDSGGKGRVKKKQSVPIAKVVVNVAGSMGTRYLLTSFTLVGTQNEFKSIIEENKDQLLDLANTAMASKTINDLEKPGARNQLRSELISIFNNALGANLVQEIYFTEFAVQ